MIKSIFHFKSRRDDIMNNRRYSAAEPPDTNRPPHSSRASGGMINHVFIMSPLQGFERKWEFLIRWFRCATPPVIHHAAASAARNYELAVLSNGHSCRKKQNFH
jgi:hypothetical protein